MFRGPVRIPILWPLRISDCSLINILVHSLVFIFNFDTLVCVKWIVSLNLILIRILVWNLMSDVNSEFDWNLDRQFCFDLDCKFHLDFRFELDFHF